MTLDALPNSKTHQILERLELLLNGIAQWLIGFIAIYMSWLCLSLGLAGTALHAWLVTIGFVFLMAQGIMAHYNANLLTHSYKRHAKTTIHWTLEALGGACGVAGILIKCIQKGFLLTTVHGKLGFATFVLCICSMCSGLSALFAPRLKHRLSPLLNRTFHNVVGFVTFALALLSQYYGYQTNFFIRKVTEDFRITMQVLTLLALLLISVGPLKFLWHKCKKIARHFS